MRGQQLGFTLVAGVNRGIAPKRGRKEQRLHIVDSILLHAFGAVVGPGNFGIVNVIERQAAEGKKTARAVFRSGSGGGGVPSRAGRRSLRARLIVSSASYPAVDPGASSVDLSPVRVFTSQNG
jgi:hypothetical protein